MNPLEYYNLVKAKINGLFRREHTPLRVIAGRSRKALLDRKIMDTYSVQLHLDAQGPINDKVKKDIQNEQVAIKGYIGDLYTIPMMTVVGFDFIIKCLYRIITSDERIIRAVPSISTLEAKARAELGKIRETAAQIGEAMQSVAGNGNIEGFIKGLSAIYTAKFFMKSFPLRNAVSKAFKAWRKEGNLDRAMVLFEKGLSDHILAKVLKGETKALEAITDIADAIKHIGYDMVVTMDQLKKSLENALKDEQIFKKHGLAVSYVEEELTEAVAMFNNAGLALRGVASERRVRAA